MKLAKIKARLPDGREFEFPEGTPKEEIIAKVKQAIADAKKEKFPKASEVKKEVAKEFPKKTKVEPKKVTPFPEVKEIAPPVEEVKEASDFREATPAPKPEPVVVDTSNLEKTVKMLTEKVNMLIQLNNDVIRNAELGSVSKETKLDKLIKMFTRARKYELIRDSETQKITGIISQ